MTMQSLLLWNKPQSKMLEDGVTRDSRGAGACGAPSSHPDACGSMGIERLVWTLLQSLLLTADWLGVVGAEGFHNIGLGLETREGEGNSQLSTL